MISHLTPDRHSIADAYRRLDLLIAERDQLRRERDDLAELRVHNEELWRENMWLRAQNARLRR